MAVTILVLEFEIRATANSICFRIIFKLDFSVNRLFFYKRERKNISLSYN